MNLYSWAQSLLNVRRSELGVTLLMLVYIYLLLLTYYLLKPVRDSLFLTELGAEQLSIVYMLTAVVTLPITLIYSRVAQRWSLLAVINGTTIFLIVCLGILRWLVTFPDSWVYIAFFIWVSLFGILTTAQFWLLANAIFSATQAKRIFVILGLGAIVGSITGGAVTSLLVSQAGVATEDLLLICSVLMIGCVGLVTLIWQRQRHDIENETHTSPGQESSPPLLSIFREINQLPLLRLIVGMVALLTVIATLIDFQFKAIAQTTFPDRANLTAFFGSFYSIVGVISMVVQFTLTYPLLRRFGAATAVILLPLGILIASGYMAIVPGLLAAVLLSGTDDVLRYSVDKTGRELLFLPVSLEVKKRVKLFIDMVVDRWFRGLGGLILFLATSVAALTVAQVSIIVLLLAAGWLTLAVLVRKEYLNAFRQAMERRELDLDLTPVSITDDTTINTLILSLGSANKRQVLYALDLAQYVRGVDLTWPIKAQLSNVDPEIRAAALAALLPHADAALRPDAERLIHDPTAAVRVAAAQLLLQVATDHAETARTLLDHDDPRILFATVVALIRSDRDTHLIPDTHVTDLSPTEADERALLAEALGELNDPATYPTLTDLLSDRSSQVRRAAVTAAGATQAETFIEPLFGHLVDRHARTEAQSALAAFGTRIIPTVVERVNDHDLPLGTRANVLRVLRLLPQERSVRALIDLLDSGEPTIRYAALRSLNAMRMRWPGLAVDRRRIEQSVVRDTRFYFEVLASLRATQQTTPTASESLLTRALQERLDQYLERIFRLLGLCFSPEDMFRTYQVMIGNDPRQRARAIEFLENLLPAETRSVLAPILDDLSAELMLQRGRELFAVRIDSREDALVALIAGDDPWLRACAIFVAQHDESLPDRVEAAIAKAQADTNEIVRQTADWATAAA